MREEAAMASWTIDPRFDTPANVGVLRYLRQESPSAHSDVAEELAPKLPGIRSYCPDPASYAFVVIHRKDATIFGLAYGQSALALRLPEDRIADALRDRGMLEASLGPTWVRFPPWASDEPLAASRMRLARWCAIAAQGP